MSCVPTSEELNNLFITNEHNLNLDYIVSKHLNSVVLSRRLTDIRLLESFVHLRFIDLSTNFLSDLTPLAPLTQLLWLKVDENHVREIREQRLEPLTYLQWFSLAKNRLRDIEGLSGPALETLNLTGLFS